MTADLDLSPEAVERFARRAFTAPGLLHAIQIAVEDCGAACKQVFLAQGDYPTVRDVADGVRNELDHAAMLARALAAENARLRAERDAALQAGAEAMREAAIQTAFAEHEKWWRRGFGPTASLMRAVDAIRALPLPDQPKEGAPPFQASTLDALLSVATEDEADAIRACAERLAETEGGA